jgi:hypothetical protein
MAMVAFLTDQLSISKILDHLGLSTPQQDKPSPVREILRVAERVRVGACRPSGSDITVRRPGRGAVRPQGDASAPAPVLRQMSGRPHPRVPGFKRLGPPPSHPQEAPLPR